MNKTFKKILSIAIVIMMLFSSIPMANMGFDNLFTFNASAEEDEEVKLIDEESLKTYGNYLYYVENNEVTIFYYTGKETSITIPSEIDGMPVKKLDESSFSPIGSRLLDTGEDITNTSLHYVEKVYIPDSVEYIGDIAFIYCRSLQEVRFSENLKEIGAYAFSDCYSLSSINVASKKLEKVEEGFIGYTEITDIVFYGGEGKELTIGTNAFRDSNVKNVTIQSDFVRLEKNCFFLNRGDETMDKIIVEGEITHCEESPFSSYINRKPNAVIVKNKPIESVYISLVGINRMGYIDNYQDKGWTYFASRGEIEWSTEGDFRYFINGNNAIITDYTGKETGTLVVPDTLGGMPVTEIGHLGMVNCPAEYIKLPDTIEKIGVYAFERCRNLKELEYNTENEAYFGANAFENCWALEVVTFNENIKKLPDRIFWDCANMSTVIAPGVTEIGDEAFSYCTALENVQFSDELHTIGKDSFNFCENLKTIGVSGEKITSLGTGAFARTIIDSFVFSDELTEIPEGCFKETSLTSIVIPESVTVIGTNAFLNCKNLESVVLSDNIKTIEKSAFQYCTSLSSIDFPESLVEIGAYAFDMCEKLSGEIRLEKNLVYVGKQAFGSTNLTDLYYNIPHLTNSGGLTYTEAFQNMGNGGFINITIGNDVKILTDSVFAEQRAVETIVIPDSVEIIGTSAFRNCTSLKNLSVSDSVTEIGIKAFEGCASLTEFTVPKNVKSLGKDVLKNCTSLKNLTISDSVTEIGIGAFEGCTSLTEFTVPKSVKSLGENAIPKTVTTVYFNAENCEFYYPENESISPFAESSIEKVVIGGTVKRIPDYFFSNYDYEEALVIPDSVTEIGKFAFENSSIENIVLPKNLVSIEEGTFSGSNIELSENSLPQSLRMIGKSAFENCDSLTELYIPDYVLDIDDSAFYDCDNLVKVRMSPNVKLIPKSAFNSCDSLTTFDWESDVKLIGEYAFADDTLLIDFDFKGVEKIYPNSFTGSGVNIVMLGENKNEEATELEVVEVSSFENCANLETLSVGGNVTTIKSAAFANCENLETAVISPAVVDIASDAFDGCDSLTIYCVEKSYAHEYALSKGIPVSTFIIDAIPNQVYTGKEIKPKVNVKVSDKKLTENTDFTVKYSDNVNVGTAKVLVSGKGTYKVLASVANFTIITKDIKNIVVAPVENQAYTGAEIKPELVVTNGEQTLTEGVDYTVTYKNNTEVGTATAEITGIGNYSGKTSVTFEIEEETFWQKIASFFRMIFNPIKEIFILIFG